MPSLTDINSAVASNAPLLILAISFAHILISIRKLAMLEGFKAILAKVQNDLTARITAMAAALASVTAERDAVKAELDALKASLADLPQVETDLGTAIDHAISLMPAA